MTETPSTRRSNSRTSAAKSGTGAAKSGTGAVDSGTSVAKSRTSLKLHVNVEALPDPLPGLRVPVLGWTIPLPERDQALDGFGGVCRRRRHRADRTGR